MKRNIAEFLQGMGLDPFEKMARMADDQDIEPKIRAQLWTELASFCEPKYRSIEVEIKPQQELNFNVADIKRRVHGC